MVCKRQGEHRQEQKHLLSLEEPIYKSAAGAVKTWATYTNALFADVTEIRKSSIGIIFEEFKRELKTGVHLRKLFSLTNLTCNA